eukprot:scaffold22589_cov138-Cylindrotheca_fusiformis.AAC.1
MSFPSPRRFVNICGDSSVVVVVVVVVVVMDRSRHVVVVVAMAREEVQQVRERNAVRRIGTIDDCLRKVDCHLDMFVAVFDTKKRRMFSCQRIRDSCESQKNSRPIQEDAVI